MKMRIAIIAASAGTLALAQTNPAQATYAGAAASSGTVASPDVGSKPTIELAKNQKLQRDLSRNSPGSVGSANPGGSFHRLTHEHHQTIKIKIKR